jgi:ERCC4-related helicase
MKPGNLDYFNDQFLKKNRIHFRQYQYNVLNKCSNRNSLVVLPTGLGKTIIAILLIVKNLQKCAKSKILILAPTRPLVWQHYNSCIELLDLKEDDIVQFTGRVAPQKRIELYIKSKIIISTPQVIKNDLERGRYFLNQVSLIVFDEAHRTKGNYAYTFIANEYIESCSDPQILGLTASPGKDLFNIQLLCDNLYIENIVFKSYSDKDVAKYMYDIDTLMEYVDLPIDYLEISAVWYNLFEKYLKFFLESKLIAPNKPYYSKMDFLGLSRDLTISIKFENGDYFGINEEEFEEMLYYQSPKIYDIVKENGLNIQTIFSYCSSCISILHAKDLLETQNISLFLSFLDRLKWKSEQDILSAKRIINSAQYKFIMTKLDSINESIRHHPKVDKLLTILKDEIEEYQNKKILIFTQYREMAEELKKILNKEFSDEFIIEKFIGQASKVDDFGYPQQKQIALIDQFRNGLINILIATSVAEEGLDIPNVDAIIFYEPVPSEIRLIQRRGRTGRHSPGRCYILLTKSTVDIPYQRVAERKETAMNYVLSTPRELELNKTLKRSPIDTSDLLKEDPRLFTIRDFQARRKKEKQILVDNTIEQILDEIEEFAKSETYKKFKAYGVTFYSDFIKFDEKKLELSINKTQKRVKSSIKKPKQYLNNNLKQLVKIAKFYNKNGRLKFSKFEQLARDENILDRKFQIHFNHACSLGFLKKENEDVLFLMDCE